MTTNLMNKKIEPISVRITRLNQLILGKTTTTNNVTKMLQNSINRELLLDSLILLYSECEKEPLKKRDKNISEFVSKFRSIIEETRFLRVNSNDFNVKALIGKGYFGNVHLVSEKLTGDIYAMKKIKKSVMTTSQVKEERDIMAKRSSEWITNLQYAFQDSDYLYLVMEYLPGGDLLSLMVRNGPFEEDLAKFYLAELTLAINDLHIMGFVHRDIKPENILIDRFGHIKLADFGNSAALNKDGHVLSLSPVGTPDYIAPELLQTISSFKLSKSTHDVTCDFWSMGIIGYEMVCETTPFHEENVHETYSKILSHCEDSHVKEIIAFPADCSITVDFKNLLENLITNPTKRFQYNKIRKHKFFEFIKWDTLRCEVPPKIPSVKSDDDISNFEDIERNKGRRSTFVKKSVSSNLKSNDFSGKDLPFLGYGFVHEEKIASDPNAIINSTENLKITKFALKIKDLQIVMKSQADEIRCLQESLLKAEQKLKKSDTMSKIFNETKDELNNLKDRLKQKTVELAASKTEIKTLQSSLKIEEEMRIKSDATISEVLSSTYKKWEKAKAISDQNYEKQIAEKKTEISNFAQKFSACENELRGKFEECNRMQEKLDNYKEKLKSVKEQSVIDKKEFEKNNEKISLGYEQNLIELKNKLRLEKDSKNRLTMQLHDVRSELDESISSTNSNKQAKITSEKNFIDLKQRLIREIELNNNLRSETSKMENLRNDIEKTVDSLKVENEKLKQELQLLECTKHFKSAGSTLSSPYATAHGSLTELHVVEEQLRNDLLMAKENEDTQKKRADNLEKVVAKLEEMVVKLTEHPKSVGDILEKQNEKLEDKLATTRDQMVLERQSARTANLSLWKLEKQVDDLIHEKKMIQRRMDLTEEKIKKNLNEKSEIEHNLKESQNECKFKNNRIIELSAEISQLKLDLRKEHKMWEKAEEERMKEKSEILDHISQVHRLDEKLQETQNRLLQTKEKNDSITLENKRLIRELSEANDEICSLSEKVSDYDVKTKLHENNYAMLKEACNITDIQLTEVEQMLEVEQKQSKEAQEKITKLYLTLREKDDTIGELKKNMIKEELEKTEAHNKIKNLKLELTEAQENLEISQTKMISQQNQLIDCTNNLFMSQEKVELLSTEASYLQNQNENNKKEIHILKEENTKILTDVFLAKEENMKIKEKLNETKQQVIELQQELEHLETTLTECKTHFNQREIKSEATLTQHKKLIDYLQLKVEDLGQQKKKRTLAGYIFGGNSGNNVKENISPNIVEQSILYRTLQEELKREKIRCKTLQDQLNKISNKELVRNLEVSPNKNTLHNHETNENPNYKKRYDSTSNEERSLKKNDEDGSKTFLNSHRFELSLENNETMNCFICNRLILCGSSFWKCQGCKNSVHRKCRGGVQTHCDSFKVADLDTISIGSCSSAVTKNEDQLSDFINNYHGDFILNTDTLHTIHTSYTSLEINCGLQIMENIILLGCNSGLYAFNRESNTIVNIAGINGVTHISVSEIISKAILIGSNGKNLYQCDLRHLQSRCQTNACLKPKLEASILDVSLSNHTQSEKWHLIKISEDNKNVSETAAIAATSSSVIIMKYDLKIQRFKPIRALDTANIVSSVLFTRHTAIIASDKFFEIDLSTYSAEEFVDLSDSTLLPSTNWQPIIAFKISSQEFLLCFRECGVFVDEYGCRSRPYDLNWEYTPINFLYREPYLFISHFQFVQIIRMHRSYAKQANKFGDRDDVGCFKRVYIHLYMPTLLTVGDNTSTYVLSINKQTEKQEIYLLNPLNSNLRMASSLETLSSQVTCLSVDTEADSNL